MDFLSLLSLHSDGAERQSGGGLPEENDQVSE
jgi:hypothetical protein